VTGEQDRQGQRRSADRAQRTVRTAVVVVHGMGEQLPLETLNRAPLGKSSPQVAPDGVASEIITW
jgi:hypothetical protein